MLVVSCPRPRFMFRVPRFVLRAPIFGHLMVGVRRNEEDRGTVPLPLTAAAGESNDTGSLSYYANYTF